MSKKIFMYAYPKMNLGDDLFIKMLCDRYPEVKFYIVSTHSQSVALRKIPNLVVVPKIRMIDGALMRMGLDTRVNLILSKTISKFCDGIIRIGGSIFDETPNKVGEFKKSMVEDKPYFVLGSNFGPYTSQEYLEDFKKLFAKTDDVCFRDDYSYDLFSDLENVRKASDIVFAYESNDLNDEVIEKRNIVISVMKLSNRDHLKAYNDDYKNHIVNLSRKFINDGYTVTMMGFCKNEGDEEAINEIIEMLDTQEQEHVESYIYAGDIDEALRVIQESQFVLGSRFHAMILAWVFHKPVYPIIYSDKSTNVINDVGFEGPYSKISNLNKVNTDEIINKLKNYKDIDIEKQIISAHTQFKKTDLLLNNNN